MVNNNTLFINKSIGKFKLIPLRLNEKDVSTDFDWLHDNNFIECPMTDSKVEKIAFYNNNCLCQLEYIWNTTSFRIRIFDNRDSEQLYEDAINDIMDRLKNVAETNDDFCVKVEHNKENKCLMVTFYIYESQESYEIPFNPDDD